MSTDPGADAPDLLDFHELNAETRPRFLAWLRACGVRESCPACTSTDYALSTYAWVRLASHIPSSRLPYLRICRRCGYVMLFQLGDAGLPSDADQRPDAVDNLHGDR